MSEVIKGFYNKLTDTKKLFNKLSETIKRYIKKHIKTL